MKILHCADVHLDSKMTANLEKDKAKERKLEILDTFLRMVDFAETNGVDRHNLWHSVPAVPGLRPDGCLPGRLCG